jgi:hypothetical protein
MFDELRRMAARQLARRPSRQRAELQAELDRWNAVAAKWPVQCRLRLGRAAQYQFRIANLRRSMEWALMDETAREARPYVDALNRALRRLDRMKPGEGLGGGIEVMDFSLPETLEAVAKDFDAREYAALDDD